MRFKIVLCGLCVSVAAFASVADDFKDASNRDGCESIPFSLERSSCASAGRDVEDWCKNSARKWNCDDLDPAGINRNIDNVNSKVNDLKKEQGDLESKRNQSSDENERKDYEKRIDEKKVQIDELQEKVDA